MYRFTPELQAGVEYNPLDDDFGALVNLRLVEETRRRPALILGTSSDRIGTTEGRAYFATLSKNLEPWLGVGVAPYAGAAYGEADDEWTEIAGLNVRWGERASSTHLWDGENLHHIVSTTVGGGHTLGLLLVEQDGSYHLGLSYGAGVSTAAMADAFGF